MAAFPGRDWVKRSKKRSIHEEADEVTGISFGSGNEVSARLYDKTRELLKSGKDYMRPLWAEQGWSGQAQVWRMKFQVRREGLPEAMLGPAAEALNLGGNLWRHLCEEWLRLAVPSDSDDTRTRWPTHPLWADLTRLWDIDPEAPPLTRVTKARLPTDDRLSPNGVPRRESPPISRTSPSPRLRNLLFCENFHVGRHYVVYRVYVCIIHTHEKRRPHQRTGTGRVATRSGAGFPSCV